MNVSGSDVLGSLSPDAFLTLFVTQIQHQDPTEPMDTSAMMAQLAQLTTVQQLDNLSANFLNVLRTEQLGLARGLIGAQVTYASGDELRTGVVDSAALNAGVAGVFVADEFVPIDNVIEILGSSS